MISPATWTTRHLQALVAALGSLLRRPLGALLTTLVIAVALALPAGLWLLVQNARAATGDLATAVQVSAFLKVGTAVERAQELAIAVRSQPGIATVTLITAEQGLKEFRQRSSFGKALDALDSNPLPHTLVIQPTTAQRDAAALERLRDTLADWPEVEIVQADTEWAQRLAALLAVLRTLFLASAVLFGLGACFKVCSADCSHSASSPRCSPPSKRRWHAWCRSTAANSDSPDSPGRRRWRWCSQAPCSGGLAPGWVRPARSPASRRSTDGATRAASHHR